MKARRPTRFVFALLLAVSTISPLLSVTEAPKTGRPNIVWIFSDDHATQAIGAYGGRLQGLNPTPNIDRLAAEGMRFDRSYVENSICSPSRAALLTGKLSHKHGVRFIDGKDFDWQQFLFPAALREAGYRTALIGKIHLEGEPRGFDHWEVLSGQGTYRNPVLWSEKGREKHRGYVTEIITDRSIDWLKSQPDSPFMLMIHHKAPHRLFVPDARHMALYEDVDIPEPDNLFDDYVTRGAAARRQESSIAKDMGLCGDLKAIDADFTFEGFDPGEEVGEKGQFADRRKWFGENKDKLSGRELVRWKYQTYLKDFLRCVKGIDEGVGKVLQAIKDSGLDENTIVLYSSDQGFFLGEHGWFDKRFMYEESFRTPLIVRWPGVVRPGSANSDLVQNIDWAPTFLEIAGVKAPAEIQGRSLVPLLRGATPADWRQSLYYHYYEFPGTHSIRRHEGVATKQYKLIRFYGEGVPDGEEWELYNLLNDPSEMHNLAADSKYELILKKLQGELQNLRQKYELPEAEIPPMKSANPVIPSEKTVFSTP